MYTTQFKDYDVWCNQTNDEGEEVYTKEEALLLCEEIEDKYPGTKTRIVEA